MFMGTGPLLLFFLLMFMGTGPLLFFLLMFMGLAIFIVYREKKVVVSNDREMDERDLH
jgi:F0F1-type ATP synthase assembly protein I